MAIDLKQIWHESGEKLFPVLGEMMTKKQLIPFDLSLQNPDFSQLDIRSFEGLDSYATRARASETRIPFGGYGEHRAIYDASLHFNNPEKIRNIHLGVDLWAAAGTAVFAPFSGRVHSFGFNNQGLDYGATIITEHQLLDTKFYLLFGHLSLQSLENLSKNAPILGGSLLATLGNPSENGGWSPHLHLQIVLEIGDWVGDYPGVASQETAATWLQNSPNPYWLLGF